MSVFKRRKRALVGVLALAAAAALIPASAASAVTFPNACKNSVTANQQPDRRHDDRQLAGLGRAGRLGRVDQHPADGERARDDLRRRLQPRPAGGGAEHDPDHRGDDDRGHEHGRGDADHQRGVDVDLDHDHAIPTDRRAPATRPATDGSFSVTYNDQTWTAGPSGTIKFREDTVADRRRRGPLHTGGAQDHRGRSSGFLTVRFGCSPGTVDRTRSGRDHVRRPGRLVREHQRSWSRTIRRRQTPAPTRRWPREPT